MKKILLIIINTMTKYYQVQQYVQPMGVYGTHA